jgi:hypothetical protein
LPPRSPHACRSHAPGTGHLPAIADLWIIATVIAVIRRRTAATAMQTENP